MILKILTIPNSDLVRVLAYEEPIYSPAYISFMSKQQLDLARHEIENALKILGSHKYEGENDAC